MDTTIHKLKSEDMDGRSYSIDNWDLEVLPQNYSYYVDAVDGNLSENQLTSDRMNLLLFYFI